MDRGSLHPIRVELDLIVFKEADYRPIHTRTLPDQGLSPERSNRIDQNTGQSVELNGYYVVCSIYFGTSGETR